MWVERAHKNTMQEDFSKTILVEKDMFCLKQHLDVEADQPSTSRRRHENVPKPTPKNIDPYDMDIMKKLLQKISNDMVDFKRNNNNTQVNNRSLAKLPFKRPYHPPQNQ